MIGASRDLYCLRQVNFIDNLGLLFYKDYRQGLKILREIGAVDDVAD